MITAQENQVNQVESGTAYPMGYTQQSAAARAHTGDGYRSNPRRQMMTHNTMAIYGQNQASGGRNFTGDKYGSNQQYAGPSYSVKYLGIVDGSMGVLSRKMALLNYNQARNQH